MVEISRARPLLGTFVIISAEGSRRAVEGGVARAFKAVEAVERRMSFFRPTSDVSRLNRGAFDGPVRVHAHTYRVLQQAQQFSLLSDGAFDVTVAGILAREGFLPSPPQRRRKGPFLSEGKKKFVPFPPARGINFNDIFLGLDRRVRFRRPLWIDLGGIAKGFAVDQALATLRRARVKKGWVNAGGDLAFFSDRLETLWARHPERREKMVSLGRVRQGALASSAPSYRSQFRKGRGISPYVYRGKSIRPLQSVTVAAPCAMWADALTKVALLDPEKAPALLQQFQARARVFSSGKRGVSVRELGE